MSAPSAVRSQEVLVPASRSAVRCSAWEDLPPVTAYRLVQLRFEVFVQGQGIVSEPEMDGADLEPGVLQWWIEDDAGVPVSTLRTLRSPEGVASIGRVATSPAARGQGLAGQLVRAALEHFGGERIEIHAQAYLKQWYGSFGFRTAGEPFDEAGIPHLLMVRPGNDEGPNP